jgi:hypothetical protein
MEVDFGTPPALQRGTVHETEQDVKLCNAGPTVSHSKYTLHCSYTKQ